jgi:excinuclease ABC subunit C
MNSKDLNKQIIPSIPGVYFFRDGEDRPLYIGRATSLRDRISSYFKADLIADRGPRIVDMITKADKVTWEETTSVLEAIILESNLIKKYQPPYNVDERDDKSSYYIVITEELWPKVFTVRARDFDKNKTDDKLGYEIKSIFGPYPHGNLVREALVILRKIFPFKDNKSRDSKYNEFYKAINRSPKDNSEKSRLMYLETINELIMFLSGNKKDLINKLKIDMQELAEQMLFEEADLKKKMIYALGHINDIALIKKENKTHNLRFEAYDVAHIAGSEVVGVMVASVGGAFDSSQNRLFKLKKDKNDDVANLIEILNRRLDHTEWQYPDFIIVDGSTAQINSANFVVQSRRINIPVIGVVKDNKHKAKNFVGHMDIINKYKDEIIALNYEAHRVAVNFHRKRMRNRVV